MLKRFLIALVIIVPTIAFFITWTRYESSELEKLCRRGSNAFLALVGISIPVCIFIVHVITSSEPGVTFLQALTRIWLFWGLPTGGFILLKIGEIIARKGRP